MEGNQMKIRAALDAVVAVGYPHNFQREAPHIRGYCYEITEAIEKCFAALSAPPRNCDVGTEEEQKYRFKAYCDKHFDLIEQRGCEGCPARNYIAGWGVPYCQLRWSQMPYEEGDNDGSK